MSDNAFSRPRVVLNRQNFLEWHRDWLLCLSSYGLAGDEISKLKPAIDFDHKPMVGDNMWQIEDVNGVEQWIQVPMSEYQRKQVPTRLSVWKSELDKYKRTRGVLMNNLINSIEENIKITVMNQPKYNEIIIKSDSIALWNLITMVMQSQGASQQDLISQWSNLKQYDPNTGTLEDIQIHINRFEQLLMNINQAANGISERRKSEQLIKSISFAKYQTIIGNWFLMIDMPDDPNFNFPSYNEVKDKIMKFDHILSKSENELTTSSSSVSAFNTFDKSKSESTHANSSITCLNCGKRGHMRRDCINDPVKCNIPGCKQWHPTQLHDRLVNNFKSNIMSTIGSPTSVSNSRGRATFSRGGISGRVIQGRGANNLMRNKRPAGHQKSEKYVSKKPSNIKDKILTNPQKKVYFTYTDEFGNNLSDQIYEEVNDTDQPSDEMQYEDEYYGVEDEYDEEI